MWEISKTFTKLLKANKEIEELRSENILVVVWML